MKEVLMIATNDLYLISEKDDLIQVRGMAELAIVVSEVVYEGDMEGLRRSRTTETIRFCAAPEALEEAAKTLKETADRLKETAAMLSESATTMTEPT